jgi:hypothetical protein
LWQGDVVKILAADPVRDATAGAQVCPTTRASADGERQLGTTARAGRAKAGLCAPLAEPLAGSPQLRILAGEEAHGAWQPNVGTFRDGFVAAHFCSSLG